MNDWIYYIKWSFNLINYNVSNQQWLQWMSWMGLKDTETSENMKAAKSMDLGSVFGVKMVLEKTGYN